MPIFTKSCRYIQKVSNGFSLKTNNPIYYQTYFMKTPIKLIALLVSMPFLMYAQTKPTSYDADGDGIPDSVDQCMYVKGVAEFKGCPYAKNITVTDRDGDGVADVDDACPDMFGLKTNKGCPDLFADRHSATGGEGPVGSSKVPIYTTTSSSQAAEQKSFKEQLLKLIDESGNFFANIKMERDSSPFVKVAHSDCLPGATSCSIQYGKGLYSDTDFGTYKDRFNAGEKFNELKEKIILALGESGWEQKEISNASGMIEKYQFTKKGGARGQVVAVAVKQVAGGFHVHVTIGI
jgi:hypothetical protein